MCGVCREGLVVHCKSQLPELTVIGNGEVHGPTHTQRSAWMGFQSFFVSYWDCDALLAQLRKWVFNSWLLR